MQRMLRMSHITCQIQYFPKTSSSWAFQLEFGTRKVECLRRERNRASLPVSFLGGQTSTGAPFQNLAVFSLKGRGGASENQPQRQEPAVFVHGHGGGGGWVGGDLAPLPSWGLCQNGFVSKGCGHISQKGRFSSGLPCKITKWTDALKRSHARILNQD